MTHEPEPTNNAPTPPEALGASAHGDDARWPALDVPAPDGPVAPITAPKPPMPEYKGEELDAERGPGLGCFWLQVILLAFFIVFTPITVELGWPPIVSAILLFVTLGLLLFVGQTVIFLLRIVAAGRRGRRVPVAARTRTVGEIEDGAARASAAQAAAGASEADRGDAARGAPAAGTPAAGDAAAAPAEPATTAAAADDESMAGPAAPAASHDRPEPDEGVRQ